MSKVYLLFLTLIALSVSNHTWAAEDSPWSVRLGYLNVAPNDDSSEISGPGLPPGNKVEVDSGANLGGSVIYQLSPQFNVEAYFALPFEHDVSAGGSLAPALGKIASLKQLPATVVLNYVFGQFGLVKPFVGAGINYVYTFDEEGTAELDAALGGPTDLSSDDSIGATFQIGAEWSINKDWHFNTALAYLTGDTTVDIVTPAAGAAANRTVDVDLDPWVYVFTFGYKF